MLVGNPAFNARPEKMAEVIAGLASAVVAAEHGYVHSGTNLISNSGLGLDSTLGPSSGTEIPRNWPQLSILSELVDSAGVRLKALGWSVTRLTGSHAVKEAVQRVRAPEILQFATHGYLLEGVPKDRDLRRWDNPLLHSMLMLAGVNYWRPDQSVLYRVRKRWLTEAEARRRGLSKKQLGKTNRVQVEDGVLTAYEVTGMNLQGTQLVNLTACKTGLGEVTPDGVAGLRQGFLLAGARSLTMSLWEIPAQESAQQMADFYQRWLGGNSGNKETTSKARYETFREAELAALKRARIKYGKGHPFYWAGMVFVGDPGDLPFPSITTTTQPSDVPKKK